MPYTHSLVGSLVWAAFFLEVGLLVAGLLVYLGGTEGWSRAGGIGFWVFAVGMVAVQATVFVGAPPPSDVAAAVTALVSYGVLAGIAAWLETKRVAVSSAPGPEG